MDQAEPYRCYGASEQLFKCRDREVLIVGPANTGKTRAVLEKLYLMALKHPKSRILISRSTRASLNESVLVTFEKKVLPLGSGLHKGTLRSTRSIYQLENGSEIIVQGLDNVDRIMSADYDAIAVFEATEATEDDWERLDTRLRNGRMGYHQLIADCNPAAPTHWLKRRSDEGKMTRFEAAFTDNPSCTETYIDSLSKLTGHRRARLYEGRWAAPEGLVFPQFQSCVVEPWAEIPQGRLVGGLDFGWNDPFAALNSVLCDDDVLYVFYERYKRNTSIAVHAAALQRFERSMWYCDPSRPDLIRELRLADIWVRGANNAILAGIDAVSSRLETRRLLISSDCRALISEAGGYSYPRHGLGEKPAAGQPDHALDALRYLVMAIDGRRMGKRYGDS